MDEDESKPQESMESSARNGPPNEVLFFVLAYLPLYELLSMSMVCRALRDAVNNDILPWLNLVVGSPLNIRLSDDILMYFTSKAKGRLRTLGLINCVKVTDDGLQQVIQKNPRITKLYVPSCTSLTPDGVIRAVKFLTEQGRCLTSLKINGIYNINKEHLKILHTYLDLNPRVLLEHRKQHRNFYHTSQDVSLSAYNENDSLTDVDICPKCDQVRFVFHCPKENCERKKRRQLSECRGCFFCVLWCIECGKCVEDEDLVEAACLDTLCSDCWILLPKCLYCNRPYCRKHANGKSNVFVSSGFVCSLCEEKFTYTYKYGM